MSPSQPPVRFRVAAIAQERGISLRQLAIRSGVTYATVFRLSRNKTRGVELGTLGRLAGVLEVAPGDLVESAPGEEPDKTAP